MQRLLASVQPLLSHHRLAWRVKSHRCFSFFIVSNLFFYKPNKLKAEWWLKAINQKRNWCAMSVQRTGLSLLANRFIEPSCLCVFTCLRVWSWLNWCAYWDLEICRVERREPLIVPLLKDVCSYNKVFFFLNKETANLICDIFLVYHHHDFSFCICLHTTEMAEEVFHPLRAWLTSLRSGRNGE